MKEQEINPSFQSSNAFTSLYAVLNLKMYKIENHSTLKLYFSRKILLLLTTMKSIHLETDRYNSYNQYKLNILKIYRHIIWLMSAVIFYVIFFLVHITIL